MGQQSRFCITIKRFILSIGLILIFSSHIYSQVRTKSRKESTKTERVFPKKSIKKVNKTPKDTNDNKAIIKKEKLQTPRVYVQETPTSIPTVNQIETAIPVFIGYTEKGTFKPKKISSMSEFRTVFGGASNEDIGEFQIDSDGNITSPSILDTPKYKMYYMLELYFANGGGDCFITSVGHYDSAHAIRNEDMLEGLALINYEDAPTLILFPDATSSKNNGEPTELYQAALAQCADRKNRFLICDVEVSNNRITESAKKFRSSIGVENLKFGAAYFPPLQTTLGYNFSEDKIEVRLIDSNKSLVLRHPDAIISRDPNKAQNSLYHLQNGKYSSQYHDIKQIINNKKLQLPPSAAIAGIYSKTDASRGVWKAPANVSLARVNAPLLEINQKAQNHLNEHNSGKSINAIRSFPGKGVMVWGARTMAGNDNDWKYIPVTRLGITVETSVRNALKQFEHLPNNRDTWGKIKAMIQIYLTNLWRSGALMGSKIEQAYFVSIGLNETMTEQDVSQGKLIVEIGIAASKPAEFSLLKISQNVRPN